jgi:hypothetical protein
VVGCAIRKVCPELYFAKAGATIRLRSLLLEVLYV